MFYFPLLDNNHVVNVNCSMFMKWYLGLISAVCQLEPLIWPGIIFSTSL